LSAVILEQDFVTDPMSREGRANEAAMNRRFWYAGLTAVLIVYLHNTLPHLTMMPRVNVDEPWLMERAYQVIRTGVPSQPMLGLQHAYLLQVGYGYLLAGWMALVGVGLLQARLLGVMLGLGILIMVASIGRRTIDPVAGLSAALFLALDSNFLGGVRNARTDIPSVFFVVAAFAAYIRGRRNSHTISFFWAGASLGLAALCHGNAFWAGLILLAWFLLDYGRRALRVPYGYAVLGGVLLTFGPYLAVVLTRWADVQTQIGNFAADRVPGWRPAFLLSQMALEGQRYRGWYFGLVTSLVPNPFLWAFQLSAAAGVVVLGIRTLTPDSASARRPADPRGPLRLLILGLGSVFIFAAFINNKVPVYLPHLLIGFALAAGAAVSAALSLISSVGLGARTTRPGAIPWIPFLVFITAYGAAGVAYFEKWYSSVGKSELVPYEATTATLRALVPAGPKYLFASPQFWTPFHADPGTTFFSYAAAQPVDAGSAMTLAGTADDRPIVLVVDEFQWLPELIGSTSSTSEWQRSWVAFIERRCVLDAVAYGSAHGTMALYRCAAAAAPVGGPTPRIIGGADEYQMGQAVLTQTAADLAHWTRYEDPRRKASAHPDVRAVSAGLEIQGTGWPGIVKMFAAAPGDSYLVKTNTANTRDGDLLYLGTWQQPQVRSLSGASSSGIPAPLVAASWFPHARAFRATAPAVRVLVYSEAPETDFVISSLEIFRLLPAEAAVQQ
jgi:4-amino-4-deoxy-L-arabinose transferase-like glycosyltransferase